MSYFRPRKAWPKKFGNVATEAKKCHWGYKHRSKLELAVCALIKARVLAGELEHIRHEVHVYLSEARIKYIPDFQCRDPKTGEILFIEAKGFEAPRWRDIRKLWATYGPARLEIWRGHHLRPVLTEIIEKGKLS